MHDLFSIIFFGGGRDDILRYLECHLKGGPSWAKFWKINKYFLNSRGVVRKALNGHMGIYKGMEELNYNTSWETINSSELRNQNDWESDSKWGWRGRQSPKNKETIPWADLSIYLKWVGQWSHPYWTLGS